MADVNMIENEKKNFPDKIRNFFKENLNTFIIVLISIVYICYGVATIHRTDKTIPEIIAASILNLIIGLTIKTLMLNQGLSDGLKDERYLKTLKIYGDKLDNNTNYISELELYCDYKNNKKYKSLQINYLRKYGLSYDKFIKGEYNGDEKLKKIIAKANRIRFKHLNPIIMLNAVNILKNEEEVIGKNINKYKAEALGKKIIIGILCAILFAYYGIDSGTINFLGMLWATLQIVVNLVFGTIEYFNASSFVKDDLRSKLVYIISCFDEFENLLKKGYFKEEILEKEVLVNEQLQQLQTEENQL